MAGKLCQVRFAITWKDVEVTVLRTHLAGNLNKELDGQTVTLTGWVARRRDHGGVIFIDLRDRSGLAQVVFRESEVAEAAHDLRSEFVVQVTGVVEPRPEGSANPNLASGEVEVNVTDLKVLNKAAALPFQIEDASSSEVGEETRLKYRYLDLRRERQAEAIRLRSKANQAARRVLDNHDFTEIETPTLTRSTPEGARDFLVPARLKPGSWYALPQSPQLFKQLLMVAGMERYYQIARCYRDEDFRADRQPEFTQLDIEASFVEQDDVIALGEKIVKALWALVGVDVPTPIRRMTYAEAMEKYGSDKPDLRFGLELTDLTAYFKDTPFRVFQNEYVGAVVMPALRWSMAKTVTGTDSTAGGGLVVVDMIGGPLRGARLQGTAQKSGGDRMAVSLNRMSWRGRSVPVNAVLVSPLTKETKIASEVQHHYAARLLFPALAAAVSAAGQAVAFSGSTVSSGLLGSTSSLRRLNPGEIGAVAAGGAAANLQQILADMAPRESTVSLHADEVVGVMFLEDVTDPG